MDYAIVYSSRTGNTKLLAETVKSALPNDRCVYFGGPKEEVLSVKRIYIGFWTNRGVCCKEIAAFSKKLTDQDVYLFGTAGFGASQNYFNKVLKRTEKNIPKSVTVIGRFMCQGKMPMSVLKKYRDMQKKFFKLPGLERLIANFNQALSHPDENDLKALTSSLEKE